MRKISPYVYLLARGTRGTLYAGVTSDLVKRIWQHQNDLVDGFSKRYRYMRSSGLNDVIRWSPPSVSEKAIKAWKRAWKIELIESANPDWRDLYPGIV